jgi:glucose/arabinose dehydrogenase
VPACELNRVPAAGRHYGFPYVHGGDVRDHEFGIDARLDSFEKPVLKLGAHVAPLTPLFYAGAAFPDEYRGNLLIAEHGSWNRSRKSGYRIMRAVLGDDGTVMRYEPFATGWLVGEAHWGRPVDLEEMADGSIVVSDDDAGVLYRIAYRGAAASR